MISQFKNFIHHIKLQKNLVFLAVTNLKCKNFPNFYKFFLLLSGDVNPFFFNLIHSMQG